MTEKIVIERITIEEIDFELTMLEDVLHGIEGDRVTLIRRLIRRTTPLQSELKQVASDAFDAGMKYEYDAGLQSQDKEQFLTYYFKNK